MRSFSVLLSALSILSIFLITTSLKAEKFVCDSDDGTSPYPILQNASYDHLRYAPREREVMKTFGAYVSSFDGIDDDTGDGQGDYLAVPQWVSYELKGVKPQPDGTYHEPDISIKRPSDWYRSDDLAFLWTDRPGVRKKRLDNSYDGIGRIWNRGHLAMADHAQRISWQASCNTHFFWNAVPQAADMNQGPWRHLEDYSAAASNRFDHIWIITGPVFFKDQQIGYIGESSKSEVPVAVPHGLFKILIRDIGQGAVDAIAFLFPQPYAMDTKNIPQPVEAWVNCSQAKRLKHVYDHKAQIVAISELEVLTGLTFLSEVSNRDQILHHIPDQLWPVDRKYWPESTCAGQIFNP
ncbi:MAG: DNA/RNA non-specific endonuclease [Rhodospirillales bacterium]|nr:DNA/RNA non-specific endonuclease [Rhodospirillales bacterium]MBR9816772.1 DNA/RNA non-specific endonuclease [Rhodospirillales bacterium]